jgi:hypothetical protein
MIAVADVSGVVGYAGDAYIDDVRLDDAYIDDEYADDEYADDVTVYFMSRPWYCSGGARISDPGYARNLNPDDLSIAGTIRVHPGRWRTCAYTDVAYISGMITWAADDPMPEFNSDLWIRVAFDVGTSSGYVGVFDDEIFPADDIGESEDETSFYGKAVAATPYGLVQDRGVVAVAGLGGDGVYEVAVIAGPCAPRAIRINFAQFASHR